MKNFTLDKLVAHDLDEYKRISSMLSKTVHDINNPLAVFVGQLSILEILLKKEPLDLEKIEKVVSKFKSSSTNFSVQIEKLRSFYKVPQSDSQFNQFHHVITALSSYFEHECYEKEITLNFSEPIKDLMLATPVDQMFIILKHLIQNAITISKENNCHEVNIEFKVENNLLLINIADQAKKLDGEFSKLSDLGSTFWKKPAPGFGLSIATHLCQKNKIQMQYSNKEFGLIRLSIPVLDVK